MAQYDNRNSGALFKNTKKSSEKAPDFSGPFTGPNGEELEIAGWVRESRNGTKLISVKVSEPYKKKEQTQQSSDFLDDEVDF